VSDRSIMVPVCVGRLKYVRRGYIAWAGDGIKYAAEEPCAVLKYEFMFLRQYKIFTPFRASSDTHFHTVYAVARLRLRIILWLVVGCAIMSCEYSVGNSVFVRVLLRNGTIYATLVLARN
jgi:hypothetical protein